ncbi:MAG: DNA-protecting protein DprA [Clostridia bacterium]|nr:DNA-protecting protein DprA [Clostridia bacterium]
MNRNAEAITIFCSRLYVADNIRPLEIKEWSHLAERLISLKLQPGNLLDFEKQDFIDQLQVSEEEAERYVRLLDRSGSLRSELSKYEDMGIRIVTRADSGYPRQLKRKLGHTCPPLFYYAGSLDLLNRQSVGYVGSRSIDTSDIDFTKKTVRKTVENEYAVVSGGAKGIDTVSTAVSLSEGSSAIEYVSGSMMRKMRDHDLLRAIRDDRMLLMSVVVPTAEFNVGIAMMRNRYIYAQSSGTIVIRSDKGKGGTWAGATENLKKSICPTFCRVCDYPGNKALLKMGAIPINDEWDGNVDISYEFVAANESVPASPKVAKHVDRAVQISLFD